MTLERQSLLAQAETGIQQKLLTSEHCMACYKNLELFLLLLIDLTMILGPREISNFSNATN